MKGDVYPTKLAKIDRDAMETGFCMVPEMVRLTVTLTWLLFLTPIMLRSGNNEKSHIGTGCIAMGNSVDMNIYSC